jgi:hypothetical protein
MNTKSKVQQLIDKYDLATNHRIRGKVYKRIILSKILRDANLTYEEIAHMFNRDHSSVVHWRKSYEELRSYKDVRGLEKRLLEELDLDTPEKEVKEQIKELREEVEKIKKRINATV